MLCFSLSFSHYSVLKWFCYLGTNVENLCVLALPSPYRSPPLLIL
jgi:hypothetical protein